MKINFELGKFFTTVYFSSLFGILGVFLYWQYSTIKEFHEIELNNFFMQTNQIVKILIKKEKAEIRDIILSNIKYYSEIKHEGLINLNNIDFTFSTKNGEVIDVDGYSLYVDVHKLAQKLKEKKSLNEIVKVKLDDKYVYVVSHKEKIVDAVLGKVKGELWGVTILNENVTILKEFKENTGVDNLAIVDENYNVVASTLEQEKINKLFSEDKYKNSMVVSEDEKFIIGKKPLFKESNSKLKSVFIINNEQYKNIFDQFKNKAIVAVVLLAILGVLLYFVIKLKFINRLSGLKYFIQNSLQNKDVVYEPSSIVELDTIASEFEHLFEKFKQYQENLEDTVKEKTSENIKQLEILQQQSKMAQMGEMIGAIAHQWRQPLNIISTGIQNLKYDYKDGSLNDEEFIKNFINENKKTIKFMSKTIDDFRSFFRTDKDVLDFKVLDTIQSVLDMQAAQLRSHHITVRVIGDEFIYNGLQSEFQQVILNIVNNAKDALIANNIKEPKITVILENNRITIEDNAGGIPAHILNRIFEPYFTTKEQGKGTGIGLYISKMIIEDNMKSNLDVKNIENGARFTIKLNTI